MSELRLYLFGAPRLQREGKPIHIDTWKALALLAYLALADHEQHREVLATLFWPEQGEAQARGSLRRALWTLRQALDQNAFPGDKQIVRLQPPPGWVVDVHQFQTLLAAVTRTAAPATDEQLVKLRAAITLYRADFLAGFTLRNCPAFDEWQFFTADRLRRRLAEALQQLIDWESSRQDFWAASAAARQWVALDPQHEPAQRRLIQLYAWSGQHAAALRQYEECKRILATELGIAPDAETTQLYAALCRKRLMPPAPPTHVTALTSVAAAVPTPAPHNLPRPLPPLVGRARELNELELLMVGGNERLITITGPGGMGKTRLALAVAERHLAANRLRDGAWFVPLAAIDDVEVIIPALANALDLTVEDNQSSAAARKRQVFDFLTDKQLLLIFDNFEQLLEGRTLLIELLAAAPAVHLLVTSRERLHLRDEQLYPLSGLACPATMNDVEAPALVLFLRLARRTQPHFAPNEAEQQDLVRICQLTAGLPLALELAASWVHLLPTRTLAAALQTNLELLVTTIHDVPTRHRSMRAAFATTWHLLTQEERRHLAHLSLFRGGFTRAAAQEVADATLRDLNVFVDQALIEYQRTADRYTMHELLRQYALEQLTAGGALADAQQRHAHYFLRLAEHADTELRGPQQKSWLDRLEAEIDNFRTALTAMLQQAPTIALALAAALGPFWRRRAITEGWHWLPAALAAAPLASPVRAKALMFAGSLARLNGAPAQARIWLEESVAFWRTQDDPDRLAQALRHLGWAYYSLDAKQSLHHFEECLGLFRRLGNQQRMAQCLTDLAHLIGEVKADFAQAAAYVSESLALMRVLGDQIGTADALLTLAEFMELLGDYVAATPLYLEALELYRLLGHQVGIGSSLVSLTENSWHCQAYLQARAYGEDALSLLQSLGGDVMSLLLTWHHLGLVELSLAQVARAQDCLEESLRLAYQRGHAKMIARGLAGLGGVAVAQQQWRTAVRRLSAACRHFEQAPPFLAPVDYSTYQSWIATARAHLDADRFTEEWARGQTMALDTVIQDALRQS